MASLISALTFTAPMILAALAALPALWLLMRATPPPPVRAPFPAFVILRDLSSAEETPDRTPWPLLALRLLLAALAIVALAGPVLNAPAPTPGAGPMVIVVDDTWPAAPHWRLRRGAMRNAAEEARAGGRAIFILTTAPDDDASPLQPLTPDEAIERAGGLDPQPFRADRAAAARQIERSAAAIAGAATAGQGRAEVRWLSDGVDGPGSNELARALAAVGDLVVYRDTSGVSPVLRARTDAAGGVVSYIVERVGGSAAYTGSAVALARDGRELARAPVFLPEGADAAPIPLNTPLALRNDIALVRLEETPSAGAVALADARNRRALIGIVETGSDGRDALLTGEHYVRRALAPYADFETGSIASLAASSATAIVLDDVGRMRSDDAAALATWVEAGGVLIRFAGSNLADSTADFARPVDGPAAGEGAAASETLLPAPLRRGGRALGGALSWETPQSLGAFAPEGPFADLDVPTDVKVRRQVLAEPGGETSAATWASLADGTPIVTGVRRGAGVVALFHVPANPQWSDLPLDGVFVDMLRRLIALAALPGAGPAAPESGDGAEAARYPPLRVLDGFGDLAPPAAGVVAPTLAEAALGSAFYRPPGYYGSPDAAIAVNALLPNETFPPLAVPGGRVTDYGQSPPTRLAAPLMTAALLMFLLDAAVSLYLRRARRRAPARKPERAMAHAAGILLLALAAGLALIAPDAAAQLNPAIDAKAQAAALQTRLAFVASGDPDVDRIAEAGLASLSRELHRRTSIEPAAPVGVDPETDDLSVYPFLYWPVVAGASSPSPEALANVEDFMRFGGLILFDTRDDERAGAGLATPEREALKAILSQLDAPPLMPMPPGHVLTRSFYLLDDLFGRSGANPVWVQAGVDANDAVTPLIIGGRDWGGAWARDQFGRALVAPGRRRLCIRDGLPQEAQECALRAGVNIVMVAFTGNYKSDQVHTPILLERLGRP